MIPEEKTAAVERALFTAFGVKQSDEARKMTKGHTYALVLRIVVRESPYLLRITLRPNRIVDPGREFECMRAAAQAGLAPRLHYTSVDDGISISDFIEESPFPHTAAMRQLPAVLRALHALPPFPRTQNHVDTSCRFLINPGPALDGFLQSFQASGILPEAECRDLFAAHSQLIDACPLRDEDLVSSHNDLFKPDNILYDGRRVWLVDWEAAFLNDRYADLAVVANLLHLASAQETAFLEQYFEAPPTPWQQARLHLMRQVAHMFYAMAFLSLGSPGPLAAQPAQALDTQAYQQAFWSGKINLSSKESKTTYGRFHWEQLKRNLREPRFHEALQIAALPYCTSAGTLP